MLHEFVGFVLYIDANELVLIRMMLFAPFSHRLTLREIHGNFNLIPFVEQSKRGLWFAQCLLLAWYIVVIQMRCAWCQLILLVQRCFCISVDISNVEHPNSKRFFFDMKVRSIKLIYIFNCRSMHLHKQTTRSQWHSIIFRNLPMKFLGIILQRYT